jgi:hypothetical protein
MKNNWILWGAVALGAYLVWKKMSNKEETRELAPAPISLTETSVKAESENTIAEDGL